MIRTRDPSKQEASELHLHRRAAEIGLKVLPYFIREKQILSHSRNKHLMEMPKFCF